MTQNLSFNEVIEKKYWEGLHTVSSHETDFKNNLSLHNLFGLLQESAYQHVKILNIGWKDLHNKKLAWIISKMKLEIIKLPVWEQDVRIRTWSSGTDGIISNRCWEVTDMKNNIIVSGTSDWLIINENTRRITRIDKDLINNHKLDRGLGNDALKKLPKSDECIKISEINARNSEIDINRHVNNTNYIKWITDSQEIRFLNSHRAKDIEINYLKEILAGDKVEILKSKEDFNSDKYYVSVNENDAARIKIKWIKDTSKL
jgi:medium-chain acyl-[acyl-carrier-protein] hydrolase